MQMQQAPGSRIAATRGCLYGAVGRSGIKPRPVDQLAFWRLTFLLRAEKIVENICGHLLIKLLGMTVGPLKKRCVRMAQQIGGHLLAEIVFQQVCSEKVAKRMQMIFFNLREKTASKTPLLYFCSSTQKRSMNAEIPCNSGFTSATARDFAMVKYRF